MKMRVQLVVVLWFLTLANLQGHKEVFNGTIEECLTRALEFNAEQEEVYAGCFVEARQPDYEDRSQKPKKRMPKYNY